LNNDRVGSDSSTGTDSDRAKHSCTYANEYVIFDDGSTTFVVRRSYGDFMHNPNAISDDHVGMNDDVAGVNQT
jgi:hypothetical protein